MNVADNFKTVNTITALIISAICLIILIIKESINSSTKFESTIVGGSHSYNENIDRIISGLKRGIPVEKLLPRKLSLESQEKFSKYFQQYYSDEKKKPTITYNDISNTIKYVKNTNMPTINVHMGQRKLFLSELQFLTEYTLPNVKYTVVYAGAAPGIHTKFLASLFPNIKFILIDPSIFSIKANYLQTKNGPLMDDTRSLDIVTKAMEGSDQIYIINDLFTITMASNFSMYKVLFISDIRTNLDTNEFPSNLDIVWNYSQQFNWIKAMNPIMSMMKFRHPFYTNESLLNIPAFIQEEFDLSKKYNIDFLENLKNKKLVFFDGIINLQAFPGKVSTETRLITDGKKVVDYGGPEEYEAKFFYYNRIDRGFIKHENDNADRSLGFDYCNDCAIENHIWKKYISVYDNKLKVKDMVAKLCKNSNGTLKQSGHGNFFTKHNLFVLLNRRTYAKH